MVEGKRCATTPIRSGPRCDPPAQNDARGEIVNMCQVKKITTRSLYRNSSIMEQASPFIVFNKLINPRNELMRKCCSGARVRVEQGICLQPAELGAKRRVRGSRFSDRPRCIFSGRRDSVFPVPGVVRFRHG